MALRRYYYTVLSTSELQRFVHPAAYLNSFGNVMVVDIEVPAGYEADADAYANEKSCGLLTAAPVGNPGDAAQNEAGWLRLIDMHLTVNDTLSGLADRQGITPAAGWRMLVTGQTVPTEDGIYIADAGAWSRAEDAFVGYQMAGKVAFILRGTQATRIVRCTSPIGSAICGVNDLSFADILVP